MLRLVFWFIHLWRKESTGRLELKKVPYPDMASMIFLARQPRGSTSTHDLAFGWRHPQALCSAQLLHATIAHRPAFPTQQRRDGLLGHRPTIFRAHNFFSQTNSSTRLLSNDSASIFLAPCFLAQATSALSLTHSLPSAQTASSTNGTSPPRCSLSESLH